jgi:hypothetical protein
MLTGGTHSYGCRGCGKRADCLIGITPYSSLLTIRAREVVPSFYHDLEPRFWRR